tara:strand:+ start:406 stop:699 length:294 start_codon:yes stop_codon:yes gene_type:complete
MSSKLVTAGGIVIHKNHILFINKNNRWDLPKGKIEGSASTRKTAITEISEETGLPKKNLHILKKIVPTHYHKNINGKTVVKKTIWYAVEFRGDFQLL